VFSFRSGISDDGHLATISTPDRDDHPERVLVAVGTDLATIACR
jgi:hypothetical protein